MTSDQWGHILGEQLAVDAMRRTPFSYTPKEATMKLSTLTGRPAHDGGCYHCDRGARPCICPGKAEYLVTKCHHTRPALRGPCPKCGATFDTDGKQIMPQHLMTQDATLDALQGLQGEHFMENDEWPDEPEVYGCMGDDDPDEPLFPRRRDVRAECEEVLYALLANINNDSKFDREFLTDVRDLMREGVPFADAVGSFAPEIHADDEAAWEAYHEVIGEPFIPDDDGV